MGVGKFSKIDVQKSVKPRVVCAAGGKITREGRTERGSRRVWIRAQNSKRTVCIKDKIHRLGKMSDS
ncbi:hypothetical protein Naga_100264g1 [Nannochloropsis gaditana]|uniref:Uncharacterized protein n=1 Tax=Nannochloropsis gaditana TaxID=72520 RepID=W7TXX5_9STRA|nr:hypothetical protein Naga_100264g1 [Nannochloropsis gaditana]